MEEIIIASGNEGKIKETQEILKEFKIISMKNIGIDIATVGTAMIKSENYKDTMKEFKK